MKDTRNSCWRDWLLTATFPEGLSPWQAGEVSWGEAGASGMSLERCQQTQSCHHPNPTRVGSAQLMYLDTCWKGSGSSPWSCWLSSSVLAFRTGSSLTPLSGLLRSAKQALRLARLLCLSLLFCNRGHTLAELCGPRAPAWLMISVSTS